MNRALCLLAAAALFLAAPSSAYVYLRCEFAQTLYYDYGIPRNELGDWVCLAQWESSYNTRFTNINTNGSVEYGIFQINDYYWCISSSPYQDCNVACSKLIDEDIGDDVTCAQLIKSRSGFSAWYGWIIHCQGQNVESYVFDCGVGQ